MPNDTPMGRRPPPQRLDGAPARSARSLAMAVVPLASALAGLALAAWLLASFGVGRIAALIVSAGWPGVAAVTAFHLPQMLASAAGWRVIAGPAAARPSLLAYCQLRWLREAVNNLLPVAQIGGEVVAVRLLQRRGVALAAAAAATVADLTIEMLTQLAFTLLGLGLLLQTVGGGGIAGYVAGFVAVGAALAAGFAAAQWLGLARAFEAGLLRLGTRARLGRRRRGGGAARRAARHATARRRRLVLAATWHGISWRPGCSAVWRCASPCTSCGRDIGDPLAGVW